MGQFALGLRSLLIKLAIFVVMAALLAWALGGTLWPRPVVVARESTMVTHKNLNWWWRLSAGGKEDEYIRWEFVSQADRDDRPQPLARYANEVWTDFAGPVKTENVLYIGARDKADGQSWKIIGIYLDPNQQITTTEVRMPDRLAVEQQLQRLEAGLPLQDSDTILRQRQQVLDPQ